jgi:hypothetical protein
MNPSVDSYTVLRRTPRFTPPQERVRAATCDDRLGVVVRTFGPVFLVCASWLASCDDGGGSSAAASGDTGEASTGPSSGGPAGDEETTGETPTVDPGSIVEAALLYMQLTRMNDEPFESKHGLADRVNVWVPEGQAAQYMALSEQTTFEEGTLIIKEQLDAQGRVDGLTIMFKGPEGLAPTVGDWWFGLVSPEGEVSVGGQPEACTSCHTGAAKTDYVFGLPR